MPILRLKTNLRCKACVVRTVGSGVGLVIAPRSSSMGDSLPTTMI